MQREGRSLDRGLRFVLASLLALAFMGGSARTQASPTVLVDGLETIEEAHVLLDAVPIRPMATDGVRLWAANVQGNCVQEFGAGQRTFDVPWNPISLAYYYCTDPLHEGEKLLVVCRGTYALVSIDLGTGEIDRLLQLPPQPADLLVDQAAQKAWVSCQARDEVVEIDLNGIMTVTMS
jgi:hypothetical protein